MKEVSSLNKRKNLRRRSLLGWMMEHELAIQIIVSVITAIVTSSILMAKGLL